MSNRKMVFEKPTNPATKFIEWKSDKKCFEFYDKQNEQKVDIPLPFQFLVLDELHAVKGWDDAKQSGIFSNEVKFIGKEPLNVRSFKGGDIIKGLYSEIKDKVKASGAHYVKSVYIMLPDGTMANVQMKGAVVQEWWEFCNKKRRRLTDEWVSVESSEERKKGATKYNVPIFKFKQSLTEDESKQADAVFDELESYLKSYLSLPLQPENDIETIYAEEVKPEPDDLPF